MVWTATYYPLSDQEQDLRVIHCSMPIKQEIAEECPGKRGSMPWAIARKRTAPLRNSDIQQSYKRRDSSELFLKMCPPHLQAGQNYLSLESLVGTILINRHVGSYSTPGPSEGDASRPAPNEPTLRLLSWATITARISRISLGTVLS